MAHATDEWRTARAFVRGCRASWLRRGDAEVGTAGDYVVEFSYEVGGRTYRGWYYAGTFRERGEIFKILYDPLHPERNTGSEYQGFDWGRVLIWVIGGAMTLFLIWLKRRLS